MARTTTLLSALCCTTVLFAQTWTQRATCPGAGRYWTAATGNSTKGYAGTGVGSFSDITSQKADIWEYDPATDAWTAIPDFPGGPVEGADAFTIGERIFFGFGTPFIQASAALYEYLPATQQWVQRAGMPEPSAYQRGFVIGDTYYMGPFWPSNVMYAYHADTDTWTTAAAYPGEHSLHACTFVVDGKGYMGSGMGFQTGSQEHWYRYDPVQDTWTPIADLLPATDQSCGATVDNTGYVYNVGGDASTMYRYDPAQDQWLYACAYGGDRTPNGSLFTVGHKAYHVFGTHQVGSENVSYSDLWEFTPADGTGLEEAAAPAHVRVGRAGDGSVLLEPAAPWPAGSTLTVWDATGRRLQEEALSPASGSVRLLSEKLGAGLRLLTVRGPRSWSGKVVLTGR